LPLENNTSTDIRTWDAKKLSLKIISEYRASLSEIDSLQRISITTIEPLILSERTTYQRTWPTIYDFVAYRAINAFAHNLLGLTKAADEFNLDDSKYFSNTQDFIELDLNTKDSLSLKYQALKTVQDLVRFHTELENPDALIDVELFRLKLIYDNSKNTEKDKLYLERLQSLLEQYKKVPHSAYIRYQIAELAQKKASQLLSNIEEAEEFAKFNNLALEQISTIKAAKSDSLLIVKSDYLLSLINRSSISLITEEVILPNENFPINIKSRNVHHVKIRVDKIDRKDIEKIYDKGLYGREFYEELIQSSKEISKRKLILEKMNDYQQHSADLIMQELPKGTYILTLEACSEKGDSLSMHYSTINVTELSYLQRSNNGEFEVLVLNRKTGEAMPNVNVQIWNSSYDYSQRKRVKRSLGTFKTNAEGLVKENISGSNNLKVDVFTKDDFYSSDRNLYTYNNRENNRDQFTTHFFTDRAIYRPGQTVYFKAISLGENKDDKWLLKDEKIDIEFVDANYQKVSTLKLKTNEFGSVSGSFVIPTGILTGRMQLKTKYGNISLQVEEYKRPQFEVELDDFTGNYKLNESIEINGKAVGFAGNNISDATFKYRVVRKPDYSFYWRYSPSYGDETEIASGEGRTNENGEFTFKFMAKADNLKEEEESSYNYQILVDVVDITGETHSTSGNINIGTTALKLSISIPNQISINKLDSFKLLAQNLNGQEISANVELELHRMQSSATTQNERLWAEPDVFLDSEEAWEEGLKNYRRTNKGLEDKPVELIGKSALDTKKNTYWKEAKDLKEGYYRLTMTAKGPFGKEVKAEQFFVVLDDNSKKMPTVDKNLFTLLTPKVEPEHSAEILVGSSLKNVKVLLEIDRKDQLTEKRWIKLNNSKQKISIPVTEKDRGNIHLSISYIFENRVYQNSATIKVPHSDKKLDIQFETFRNKLYPGQKEHWKIKIKGHKGEKVASEFLATLYDASLDQFASNNWSFDILDYYYGKDRFSAQGFGTQQAQAIYTDYTNHPNPQFSKPRLNWFGFNSYGRYYPKTPSASNRESEKGIVNGVMSGRSTQAVAPVSTILMDETGVAEESKDLEDTDKSAEQQNSQASTKKGRRVLKTRTNFNETAFFYPQLKTNEDGDVIFSFTMPESLTKWNFKGFAHTEDLKYGFINEEIITQKELMVMPNAPRFFREGDKMEFPVKVVNLSKETQKAEATIRFYDALTMKEITTEIYPDYKKHQLEIEAGQSAVFKASLQIPEGYQAISYKVIASTTKFADGEEKAIPVLTNRMLVTESLPLPIRGKGVKNYTFEKLVNNKSTTLKHYNFTLEMTSNPAWYAVQALPYLAEYPYECAEQTFSRFYANALASHIANSNPKIKSVFDAWRSAPKSETLLSNLDKNQELKSALLAETPWVMDAQNETEQKRRIAMLFDLNQLSFSQKSALRKLKEMQVSSGAWPWFKGMRENRYITQLIVSGMGHLRKLDVLNLQQDYQTKNMIVSAIRFLDNEIADDYNRLKKNYDDKQLYAESHTNQTQIQYLYMRSFFNDIVPLEAKYQKAVAYFTKNSQAFWVNQSQYLQAMIALTSIRAEESKTGIHLESQIVASLKEHALHSDEMGMYWKSNSGYYWYQAPIEKQAIMIELFSEIGGEEQAVEDLKVWLLKQKQTQNWKTTRSTADAIYALLMNGTDILSDDEQVKVSLGGKEVKLTKDDKVEAGTGYYKKSWKGEEIKAEMGNISLSKNTEGVSWGAVYWQYFEDLDKITPHKTPLHLEKELFIEKNSKSGPVLTSIQEEDIKVGDKIVVRIILRVDRAMEYVHLKDMRASGFEPLNVMSGYRWKNGLGYYESTKDASTNFFFDYIQKGTYVFEYPLRAVHEGDFSNGISNIQCMYAPEFTSHSKGIRVEINE